MDDLPALMFVNGSVSPGLLGNGAVWDRTRGRLAVVQAPVSMCPTAPVAVCLTGLQREFNQLGFVELSLSWPS